MSNVTFGTLTVNGHTVQGAPPLVTHLFHVGTNVVTLTAPPFEAHTCRFLFSERTAFVVRDRLRIQRL
ncbi:MAG TPA: hypothetical protein VGS80_09760 [Ktedonobacterales bacterium]|nr:hypothetical protein [Ktedonobacterales bacterium]